MEIDPKIKEEYETVLRKSEKLCDIFSRISDGYTLTEVSLAISVFRLGIMNESHELVEFTDSIALHAYVKKETEIEKSNRTTD